MDHAVRRALEAIKRQAMVRERGGGQVTTDEAERAFPAPAPAEGAAPRDTSPYPRDEGYAGMRAPRATGALREAEGRRQEDPGPTAQAERAQRELEARLYRLLANRGGAR